MLSVVIYSVVNYPAFPYLKTEELVQLRYLLGVTVQIKTSYKCTLELSFIEGYSAIISKIYDIISFTR